MANINWKWRRKNALDDVDFRMKVTIVNGEDVLGRPTSIYGAAVALRRNGQRWVADGLSPVILVDGEPITPEQKATVNETWRPYLDLPSPTRIEIG